MKQPQTLGDLILKFIAHGSSMGRQRRSRVYAVTLLVAAAVIWLPVLMYLLISPTRYYSEWSLVLPVSGAGHAVQLESIGQASSSELSPYANAIVDPRVNYKAIALSRPVLATAAQKMGMRMEDFGKPRIKLVDQTALMNFRIAGNSAEDAHQRAEALVNALNAEITRLRMDELRRREEDSGKALASFSESLTVAQKKIIDFQSHSKIISLEQFADLAMSIERSRKEQDALQSRRAGLASRIASLEKGLGIPTGQAGRILALQNDAEFQLLQESRAQAAAIFAEYNSRWGEKHFKVVSARENASGMNRAMQARAFSVAGVKADSQRLITLANNSQARDLIQELVEREAEAAGLDAEISALDEQVELLSARIEDGTGDAVALEDLKRKQQVAMAVFTTALAKLDLGKTDSFSSYPMLQTLAIPTLPAEADTLGLNLALLGGVLASLLCITGLLLLWIRKPYLQKILKNA